MKAAVIGEQLVVDVDDRDMHDLYFERNTIGSRYGFLFGANGIPEGFTAEGKLHVAPLEDIADDTSGLLSIHEGRLSWGALTLVTRLDNDGDLGLFVSDSFFIDPREATEVTVAVSRQEIQAQNEELLNRVIPTMGICLRRIIVQ